MYSLESGSDKELTLRDLAVIYRRRRKIIYSTVVTLCVLAAIYCIVCTRRYEAIGTIQIQKESSDGMGLESMMSGAADSASDALDANINIATQASILQSDTLALRTIEDLNLENTKDFQKRWNPIGWVLGLLSPGGAPDPPNAGLENSPDRRRHALKVFSKNLTVKPVSGTRLIEIDYLNPDPKLAAAVVNKLTQGLVDYTFQTRFTATNQASDWLRSQLGDLRKESEDLQKQVVALQSQSGVYALGNVDASGKELAYSGVLDQLQQETAAVNQAQQNRILRGAIARAAENGDAEMLSGLAGNSMAGSPTNNSLLLLQNLRQQEAAERAALAEAEAKYGSAYPKLAEMRGNLAGLESSIRQEVERVRARAKSDYEVAAQAEKSSRSDYEQAKAQADKLNDKAIEFAIVRQDAEESRQLYEGLVNKLREAGVLEGLKSSNITIVDPGRVPFKPKKPNVPLYMAIALCGGLFLGGASALFIDTMDNKINTIADAEEITGRTILGVTPEFVLPEPVAGSNGKTKVISLNDPQSTFTESLRAIRTSILLTRGGDKSRVIMVTSAIPSEGKSVMASNLAVVLAQSDKKVLLIDVDLRRGTLRNKLSIPKSTGLSNLLAGQRDKPEVYQLPEIANLDIMQSGSIPPNPAELLGVKAFENWISVWRQEYDFVVLDCPPLLPVTDSAIIRPHADIAILVARCGLTERPQLRRGLNLLTENNDRFVGVVLNGLRINEDSYYGYYGYRKYAYKYGEDKNGKA